MDYATGDVCYVVCSQENVVGETVENFPEFGVNMIRSWANLSSACSYRVRIFW